MRCSQCGADNADNRRFCGACGTALALACGACGFSNEAGSRYCGGCGAALAVPAGGGPSHERRQVAVLFVDLVGFTALTDALGAEQTQVLLDAFFGAVDTIVEQTGGTVDKHIGDCVMAVFGAPRARGDDVGRAVRAAVAILAAMPEISARAGRELRVHGGIAAGGVVAGGVGDGPRGYTVTGEIVNLAARLADRASAGEVLVADSVRVVLGGQIRLEEVGELTLQGLSRPERVHRLLGFEEAASVDSGALVGRVAELRQLIGAVNRLGSDGVDGVVVLRGDAGVGKSRLVRELERRAADHGVAAHTALVLDSGLGASRGPLSLLARQLVADGTPMEGPVAWIDPPLRPFLLSLMGVPLDVSSRAIVAAAPIAELRGRINDAFAALVRATAARQQLLLIIEDLHWAGADLLLGLAAAVAGSGRAPVLFILTSRHESCPIDPTWLAGAGNPPTTIIDLDPLRTADALALAHELMLGCEADAVARCVERAQGNPLFLEQLARHLRERFDDALPVSVQTLVQARLDRLEAGHRAAMRAAAVLGQRFSLAALRAVVNEPVYEPGPLIQRLFLRPDQGGLLFAHALIRDAVYDLLLVAQRRELHLRAATYFADQDAVLHAQHLDQAADPRASAAYVAAARQQAESYRTEMALDLAQRGVSLAATAAERFAAAALLGRLQLDLGRAQEGRDAFTQALQLAADQAERGQALFGLAEAMRHLDGFDTALAHLSEAEAGATARDQPAELVNIHHLRGNIFFPLGRVEECAAEHDKALFHARRTGSPELLARALGGVADAAYARGRMVSAHDAFSECCALAREHGLARIEAANLPMVAVTSWLKLDLDAARREAADAIELAARIGHPRGALIARHAAWFSALLAADHTEAEVQARETEILTARVGSPRFQAEYLMGLGEAQMLRGDRSGAARFAEEALDTVLATAPGFLGPAIYGLIAWSALDASTRSGAIREAEALLRAGSVSHNHLLFGRYATEAAISAGDWREAARLAAELERYGAGEPVPWAEFFVRRTKALAEHARAPTSMTRQVLTELRADATASGIHCVLPTLDAAISAG